MRCLLYFDYLENNLTDIEKYIIQGVKEIRISNNLTPEQLSLKLDKGPR
jgi:hypothetical protein